MGGQRRRSWGISIFIAVGRQDSKAASTTLIKPCSFAESSWDLRPSPMWLALEDRISPIGGLVCVF
jgi:hypothetical protein